MLSELNRAIIEADKAELTLEHATRFVLRVLGLLKVFNDDFSEQDEIELTRNISRIRLELNLKRRQLRALTAYRKALKSEEACARRVEELLR